MTCNSGEVWSSSNTSTGTRSTEASPEGYSGVLGNVGYWFDAVGFIPRSGAAPRMFGNTQASREVKLACPLGELL